MKRVFTCLFLALSVAILPGRADAGVVTSYSLVAHDPVNDTTVLLVRAVVDGAGADCPAFVVNGADAPVSKRQNPDADQFPVTVCEAKAPLDATVTVDGTSVPTMAGHDGGALDLAIFGDSGCSPSHQNCTTGWPYPELIAAAVEQQPDLVIHVGDYDYRGTPSRRAKDDPRVYDGCVPAADVGYVSLHDLSDWETWNDDLMAPSADLMSLAPWVVVRGNHELCSRGGDGWFYLLDPHSSLLAPLFGEPICDAPIVTTEPYAISIADLDMVVLDNSNGCDSANWQDAADFAYQERLFTPLLRQAAALADESSGPVWLLTHRPFWSANLLSNGVTFDGSDAWQQTLRGALDGSLPENVAMVLSGHVHEAQALSFDGDRPPQIVLGNSGTHLDPNGIALPVSSEIDGMTGTGWVSAIPRTTAAFGYLAAELDDAAHWQGQISSYAPDGSRAAQPLMDCFLPIRDGVFCEPPAP
ncbi:MAG: hypothetical protein HOI34_03100 [Rhodospirillaceae bacterium]|jgi:hypothetical protein|nr:hypothetical protein [Rhodospirillaceae bacterium]MBT6202670.1 hypothetical protein [Rhodospirillaceae bacterium]MBT6509647.1 hypothetical protein [Rhodospirillaceae bacterium]MBT7648003.1 hypothetical protein [Rhodospirillaceae bacterium]